MKQWLFAVVVAALMTPAVAQAEKFAYVDLNFALNNVEEGKKAKTILERDYERKKKELESENQKLKALRDELEAKRMVLQEDALRRKLGELEAQQLAFQKKLIAHQQSWAKKEGELTAGILEKLVEVVKVVGKQDGYDYVFEKTEANIIYAPSSADLTGKVIKAYNRSAGKPR